MKVTRFFFLLFLASCSSFHTDQRLRDPVENKIPQFRQCFVESDSYLGREDPMEGIITIGYHVNKDGSVSDTKIIKSPFKDSNLHACILGLVRDINFGESSEATEVTQPIRFSK